MNMYQTKGYIAWSKDENNRRHSTSGGIFYEIAQAILSNDGIVYGAVFDSDFSVKHSRASNIKEVQEMRGSKYVQSKMGDILRQVKADLQFGKKVLFTGTPCQIAGLKSYLQKNYNNLICMDFVCLGVPSPGVWEDYLSIFHNKKEIRSIIFKEKKMGWTKWTFFVDKGRKVFRQSGRVNLYMQGYLQHLYIRPSCYECRFRKEHHLSDITVADCWGIDNLYPELNDEKGISTVLVHSDVGEKIISDLSNTHINCRAVGVEPLLKGNPYATMPIQYNKRKGSFVRDYTKDGLKTALKKNLERPPLWKRIFQNIKWILISLQESLLDRREKDD